MRAGRVLVFLASGEYNFDRMDRIDRIGLQATVCAGAGQNLSCNPVHPVLFAGDAAKRNHSLALAATHRHV